MQTFFDRPRAAALLLVFFFTVGFQAQAQSNSGSIDGTVLDPTSAAVPNATVQIQNPVSHLDRSTSTDSTGKFSFANIPFNPYHLSVTREGFDPHVQDVEVRSLVPLNLTINLKVKGSLEVVTVESGSDLVDNDSTAHSDVDRGLFDKIPLESVSSSLSSLVTLATPGIAADSNGLFHALGDHAENSFSIE